MRVAAVIKSNGQLLLGMSIGLGIILCLEFLPKVVGLFFNQPWPSSVDLNDSLILNSLTMIFLVCMVMVVGNKWSLFAQFNVPRKDQYMGNLLTILFATIILFIMCYVVYPTILSFFFDKVMPRDELSFVGVPWLNKGLNGLNIIIELLSAGLGGYFIATFIKRFSVKWFVVFALFSFIALPLLLVLAIAIFPNSLVNSVTDFFGHLTSRPVYYFALTILELIVTALLIKWFSKGIAKK